MHHVLSWRSRPPSITISHKVYYHPTGDVALGREWEVRNVTATSPHSSPTTATGNLVPVPVAIVTLQDSGQNRPKPQQRKNQRASVLLQRTFLSLKCNYLKVFFVVIKMDWRIFFSLDVNQDREREKKRERVDVGKVVQLANEGEMRNCFRWKMRLPR